MSLLKMTNALRFESVFSPQGKQKLRGGLLLALGFMLSPLCWWNDLIINLPLAYGVGYLCNWLIKGWLMPGAIAGYWLSNVVGIVLMQVGSRQVFQASEKTGNFKQALWSGVISSTVFTAIALLLMCCHVLDIASFSPTELLANLQGDELH